MDMTPTKTKVISLVEQAQKGTVCLPNFQRDFVWTRNEVAELSSTCTHEIMRRATASLSNGNAVAVYHEFTKAREAAIIDEIRDACHIA